MTKESHTGKIAGAMETVYLETTVISYLASEPSRDLVVAGHQQITREWWTQRRSLFACSIAHPRN